MAFAAQCECLVPTEGSAHDLVIRREGLSHAFEDLDGRGGRGEVGAEVGVG